MVIYVHSILVQVTVRVIAVLEASSGRCLFISKILSIRFLALHVCILVLFAGVI